MASDIPQSLRTSRSSFSSSNGYETPSHYSAVNNGDDYDSDGSNFAPPTPMTLSSTIPAELAGAIPLIDKFQVEGFLRAMQKQINSAGKRGFFSKRSVGPQDREKFTFEDMLCFQRDPIPTSLLKINGDLVSRAVKLFQTILKYTGIDSSEKANQIGIEERIELVGKLYKQALKRSELRDEIFAQISKQTRNCPDRQHLIRAWELMYLCASCMPPSKDIGGYLSEYIHDVAHNVNTDPDVQAFAMSTLNALKCSVKAGPRHTIPGREEIEALLIGKKLTTIVFFLDETFEEIAYDMATTVANAVEKPVLVKYLLNASIMARCLFESNNRCLVTASKSPEAGNEEYIGLDDNKYIGDLLAEFKSAKDRSKGEISQCKLTFKKKLFRESDESITDPMFVQLSYVQLQHDYILGNYPVGKDDAAKLSALQILVEIGFVDKPEACTDWTLLLERFLPRQIAITRAKRDWELDILKRYCSMENLTKEDARHEFLRTLRMLPYGYSVFFSVRKIDDPIGLLPGRIILGINKRGVHFFRPVPKEYLHSAELRDIMQFGSSNTAVFFKMRVAGVLHIFQFETKQGEEICVALQTHINDVMLRRYSKARSATTTGPVNGDVPTSSKPPNVDVSEKRAQDLAKALEETQKTAKQLSEELLEKQRTETSMQEEVETLKDMLRSEKKNLEELSSKHNELRSLCQEKESALQAAMIDKQNMEARLSQLSKGELESNTRKELVEATNQVLRKIQDELRIRSSELHAAEETTKKLYNEKMLLEERISRLEKKKVDEVRSLEKDLEQERMSTKPQIIKLERKVEELTRKMAAAESSLALKDAELSSMHINVKEIKDLREMKEDIDRKNEQTAAILKMQAT
uniref:Kinesin-like calmodulin-binding protein n=2 Tax=Tanacetum cinerariifolium TaxID=118510 RepID=A0A6L2KFI2_TANCI|nr:kinesin-like protein KIN-14E [Tanacetum cinerariifolium]